ncbi:unnamed protein product [Dibothriocephalus latus]|uniref:Uncharacterized protein n=1 Tax=Dibothriocephalus latus TaxID=60516 RepID=A0A3P7MKP4_DIBLA|nr:unnamed protein product [Dibothriocephalus latus]
MDGIERSGKVNKADGCWLLVAMAEFKDPSQCEYLALTSASSAKSDLVRSRPGAAHRLDPSQENSGEDLRSNVDKVYAAVVCTSRIIPFLVDRHKDARALVIRNCLVSPRLSNHPSLCGSNYLFVEEIGATS